MAKFHVCGRNAVEQAAPVDRSHIFISIITPGDKEAKLNTNEHTRGILRLAFDDADTLHNNAWGEPDMATTNVLFTEEMAKQVIDFVRLHKLGADDGVEDCIVHCDAGRSRSRGLAGALSYAYNGDDRPVIKGFSPNMLVYRKVLNAHINEENNEV